MNSNFYNNNSQTYSLQDKNSFLQNDENIINTPFYPLKKELSKNFKYTNTTFSGFIFIEDLKNTAHKPLKKIRKSLSDSKINKIENIQNKKIIQKENIEDLKFQLKMQLNKNDEMRNKFKECLKTINELKKQIKEKDEAIFELSKFYYVSKIIYLII